MRIDGNRNGRLDLEYIVTFFDGHGRPNHLLRECQSSTITSRGRIYSFYPYPSRKGPLQMGRLNQSEPERQAPTRIVRQIFHLIYCQITVTQRRRKWLTINWRNDTSNGAERLLAETSNASNWTITWSRYVHWIATFLPRPWCCETNTAECYRCSPCHPYLEKRRGGSTRMPNLWQNPQHQRIQNWWLWS